MIEFSLEEEPQALAPHDTHHPAYSSIESENGEIRLLELLPGKYDDPLSLRLLPKKSNEDIEYEALSYAWGTTDSPHEALLDGTPTSMRVSLDLGLRRLRYAEKSRILWVDALCINQNNVQERSHQVQQMATIYSSATTVVIWLGEWPSSDNCRDEDCCEEAFSGLLNEMRRINSLLAQTSLPGERDSLMSKFLAQNDLFSDMGHFIGHLTEITSQPWFHRLWIIQEFILAKTDPVVHVGRHSTTWPDLFYAVEEYHRHYNGIHRDFHGRPLSPVAMRKLNQMRYGSGRKRRLSWWLAYSTNFRATDSRDNIYGLLGVCDFQVADPIVPDYSKSFQQVLAETTVVEIIEESPEFYLEFPLPLGPVITFLGHMKTLDDDPYQPSWSLNQSIIESRPPRGWEPLVLSLEERKRRNSLLRLSEDNRTLFTQGRYVGTISAVFPCSRLRDDYDETVRGVTELYKFYHRVLKPIDITPQRLYELVRPTSKIYGDSKEFATYLSGVGNKFHLEVRIMEIDIMERRYTKDDSGGPQTLIVTEEGDLGITWHQDHIGLQAGDIVVNLFGYNVPFILRPCREAQVHLMLNVAQFEAKMRQYPYDWIQFEGEGGEEYALI